MILFCPKCDKQQLNPQNYLKGKIIFRCDNCRGSMVNIGIIKKDLSRKYVESLFRVSDRNESDYHCPSCKNLMFKNEVQVDGNAVELEYCTTCSMAWFDHKELETIPNDNSKLPRKKSSSDLFTRQNPQHSINVLDQKGVWDGKIKTYKPIFQLFFFVFYLTTYMSLAPDIFFRLAGLMFIGAVLAELILKLGQYTSFMHDDSYVFYGPEDYFMVRAAETLANTKLVSLRRRYSLYWSLKVLALLGYVGATILFIISLWVY